MQTKVRVSIIGQERLYLPTYLLEINPFDCNPINILYYIQI